VKRSRTFGGIFDLDQVESKIQSLEQSFSEPGFWDDQTKANKIVKELKRLKGTAEPWKSGWGELQTLEELSALVEPTDTAAHEEMRTSIGKLLETVGSWICLVSHRQKRPSPQPPAAHKCWRHQTLRSGAAAS